MRWLVIILLLSTAAYGAIIEGTVYDFSLEPVRNAIVEIDTTPHQVMVARDGTYRFNIPSGHYSISAESKDQAITENITITGEGNYILDLILIPDIGYEEQLLGTVDESEFTEVPVQDDPTNYWPYVIAALALLGIWLLVRRRKKPAQVDEPLKKILSFIEKEGRTTQKDIYKNFPWSESKISLMLDELESKGLIRKVKKGRSNLIFRK